MGFVLVFLYREFVVLLGILCTLFKCHLFRRDEGFKKGNSVKNKGMEELEPMVEPEAKSELGDGFSEKEETGFSEKEETGFLEKEETGVSFQFKFPSYEEFCENKGENVDFSRFEVMQSSYQFSPVEGLSRFMKEPEIMQIRDENYEPFENSVEIDEDLPKESESESESICSSSLELFSGVVISSAGENHEEINSKGIDEDLAKETELDSESEPICSSSLESVSDEVINLVVENVEEINSKDIDADLREETELESESESICVSSLESVSDVVINTYSDGFLSDCDFEDEFEVEENEHEMLDERPNLDETETKAKVVNEEKIYTIDELKKIEEAHYKSIDKSKPDFVVEKDFGGEIETESKKGASINESDWDSDELWEHQDLIEQLKMELKKVKAATGLPTILEESESPKIADDLKPWKIDEKLKSGDRTGELHKIYKSYRDRMRKLDILNYQKMYAINFLQLKDPLQSISPERSSIPSVSTLLSHNIFPSKHKKIGNDPMMKFIFELQSDLESVYVGHMCLSWEILHWQYGKALDIWESDPRGIRTYNEVAGDFQQFQVLMQRFLEDEAFQGPRVQNYVRSRCTLRNLLQVPLIKEDNYKDKKKALNRREMGDLAITSDTLIEILEESIRIFWRFVRADKDCSNVVVKSRKGLKIELQDPSDFELLMEIQANLQKKEKRLKDLLRGGNCILRKFKKQEEDDSDQVLFFFSQVDMKLVGRVLNMPRITTDQLIWCGNKLQKISFVNKKIKVEPSFLLFPC